MRGRLPAFVQFYADQLAVVEGVVNEVKNETVVIVTLYSPFMFAEQTVGADVLARHIEDDPVAVAKGLERIVESMAIFIRGCIARGIDGFYGSTQGGEKGRFPACVFDDHVKPTDLMVWDLYKQRIATSRSKGRSCSIPDTQTTSDERPRSSRTVHLFDALD